MSKYYNPNRKNNLYDPKTPVPFRLSRSKIELFLNCPRCFYLDRRIGVAQPPGYPFSLNSAVDTLLKKEFDAYRTAAKPHPLMTAAGLDAVPFKHPHLNEWRDALRGGITYQFPKTNLMLTGAVDDIWVKPDGELIIVDYKATSKVEEVTLDADWQDGYKRQMEIYQWLYAKNEYAVSPTGYFLYCNGDAGRDAFNQRLEFSVKLIPYTGDHSWVEGKIRELYTCLQAAQLPAPGPDCDYCKYREAAGKAGG